MTAETGRSRPPIWRHDAYTLRRLSEAIDRALQAILVGAGAGAVASTRLTAIDVGAGDAPYRGLFESKHVRYISCDLAPTEPTQDSHASAPDVLFVAGGRIDLADASADIVVSFQVLEHVWDLDWYLGECRRLLKHDGTLLLSTHGTWLYHPHPTDFRRWTRDGLVLELETRGFEVSSVSPVVGPLAWTTQFRNIAYHHLLSRVPVIGGGVAAALSLVMYVRMIVEDWLTPSEVGATNAAVYLVAARRRSDAA